MAYLRNSGACPPESAHARCLSDLDELIAAARPRSMLLMLPDGFGGVEAGPDGGPGGIELRVPTGPDRPLKRYDVAVLFRVVERLGREPAQRLIASLRDLHAERLYVVVGGSCEGEPCVSEWTDGDLFALGMRLQQSYSDAPAGGTGETLRLFSFSLSDYKTTPEWLNSNYWANPELFGKFRW